MSTDTASPSQQCSMIYPRIIVTGDSIAAGSFCKGGYGADLVARYAAVADVVNRGAPGFNSTQLLQLIKENEVFVGSEASPILLWLIHIGTNDCTVDTVQHTSLTQFGNNLREMVALIKRAHPDAEIVLLSPARADAAAWTAWAQSFGADGDDSHTRPVERAKAFADTTMTVAADLAVSGINVFDLFEKMMAKNDSSYDLFYDGLHYTPKAYQIITDSLVRLLNEMPNIDPFELPLRPPNFPTYHMEENQAAHAMIEGLAVYLKEDPNFLSKLRRLGTDATRKALIERGYPDAMLP